MLGVCLSHVCIFPTRCRTCEERKVVALGQYGELKEDRSISVVKRQCPDTTDITLFLKL